MPQFARKSYNFILDLISENPRNHNKRSRIHEMQLIVKLFNTNI